MNKLVYFFLLLFSVTACMRSSDSTVGERSNAIVPDTLTSQLFKSYLETSQRYTANDKELSLAYIDSAHTVAVEAGHQEYIATANLLKAAVYTNFMNRDSALYYINSALDYFSQSSYSTYQSMCFALAADIYVSLNETEKARSYLDQSLKIAVEQQDTIGVFEARSFEVVLLAKSGLYREAIEVGLSVLEQMEGLNEGRNILMIKYNLTNNLAGCYSLVNEVDTALIYVEKAYETARDNHDTLLMSLTLNNLSGMYYDKGMIARAKSANDSSGILLGERRPRFYENYLRNRMKIYEAIGEQELSLAAANKLIAELDSGLVHQQEFKVGELLKKLEDLNSNYKLLQVQNDKLRLERFTARRNYIIYFSFFVLATIVVVLIIVNRRSRELIQAENQKLLMANDKLEVMTRMQNIRAEHVKREAAMVERQHMAVQLHNTVANSLAGIIFRMKNTDRYLECKEVEKRLTSIYEELRFVIESEEHKSRDHYFATDEDFREFVRGYFEDLSIEVSIQNEAQFDLHSTPIETLSVVGTALKEIFVNALKYANCSQVLVYAYRRKDIVVVRVEDNGNGFDVDKLDPDKRTGILAVKKDIEQLPYGRLIIESELGMGTSVTLECAL